jgi:hypothetical protein
MYFDEIVLGLSVECERTTKIGSDLDLLRFHGQRQSNRRKSLEHVAPSLQTGRLEEQFHIRTLHSTSLIPNHAYAIVHTPEDSGR